MKIRKIDPVRCKLILTLNTMSALTNIWNNYTLEFSTVQKIVIGVVLGMIFLIALMAIVLVIMEIAK